MKTNTIGSPTGFLTKSRTDRLTFALSGLSLAVAAVAVATLIATVLNPNTIASAGELSLGAALTAACVAVMAVAFGKARSIAKPYLKGPGVKLRRDESANAGGLVSIAIAIAIALVLFTDVIIDSVATAQANPNIGAGESGLVGIIGLVFVGGLLYWMAKKMGIGN